MYPKQEIQLQVKQINFQYQLINKTYSIKYPAKWFLDLKELLNNIKEKYKDKNIKILEEESDCLSSLDRMLIKNELKDMFLTLKK